MKLIGSTSSPYVRKVRIVMAEKKLDYEFVAEDVWSAETTIAQSNPLGKVPCLVMEGGEALFDSRVIVVGCALGYVDCRFAEVDWRGSYPNLAKLHEKLALRQSFADTKPA